MELQLDRSWAREPEDTEYATGQRLSANRDAVELEQRLCDYVGAEHCVCVDSATTGLLLALKAADVGYGDTVLCTSFSYFATARVIELTGAKPMYVDINPNTLSVDPYCLEYIINKCLRTRQPLPKALVAVDLFGLPCDYAALEEICGRHGITLIEDMAMSFGAVYQGRRAGSFGRFAVASFFPAKPIGEMGEGGAVFCHTQADAQRLYALRRKIRLQYGGDVVSGDSRPDAVQASVAGEKLAVFDKELKRRARVADRYRRRLEGRVRMQQVRQDYHSAHSQFVLLLPDEEVRARVMDKLRGQRIPCYIFEPSPVGRDSYSLWDRVALVNARSVEKKLLALPMHPYLSGHVVDYICDHVLEALTQATAPAAVAVAAAK